MPFIDIDGARIRFRETGTGPAVLLLHGAGGSSAVWIGTLRRLARTHHAFAPDLPGHGRSTGGTRGYEDIVQSVGAFAAVACVGRAVLLGHSLGGHLALSAALRWPDKVAGLIVVTTASAFAVSPRLLGRIENDWPAWHGYMAELAHSAETPPDTRRRSAHIAFPSSREQTYADFAACNEVDLTPRLAEIRVPAVVVSGADDLLVPPKRGAALAEGLGCPHVVVERTGHFPMHEQPDRFFAAVANALAAFGH